MNEKSKNEIRDSILNNLQEIHNRRVELSKGLDKDVEDCLSFMQTLFTQLSQPSGGFIVPKTPKMLRKKAVQRIETILEDEVFKENNVSPTSSRQFLDEEQQKENEVTNARPKRRASKKADDNIKKSLSILDNSVNEGKKKNNIKRKKPTLSTSDEDGERVSKYSKIEKNSDKDTESRKVTEQICKQVPQVIVTPVEKIQESKNVQENNVFKSSIEHSKKTRSNERCSNTANSMNLHDKEANKDDAIIASNIEDVEVSIYEDAIGKPVPIMNSTLKHSLTTQDKILNATVVLERLPQKSKLNETVVIKTANTRNSKKLKEKENIKNILPNNMHSSQKPEQYDNCNGLITDDESSPEIKKPKKLNKNKRLQKEADLLLTSSEDVIPNTPEIRKRLKEKVAPTVAQENKITYKQNALFSPYAKNPVKKRVEAFEQAVMHSPKTVEVEAPVRITRTKTRAMATAEMQTETKNADKSVTQILAHKSLVKAKRISLAKQKKNNDEIKENKEPLPERINRFLSNQTDKPNVKQLQQIKTTPLSKIKLLQPTLSVPRLHTPLNTQSLANYTKTVGRTNIVTNVDSFIPPPKNITKINSFERLDEKRRHEEDARKKREETLKLLMEEKRRKREQKELKNKLAREAKEKLELEKRQKAEKEREEKAKIAFAVQEKQREELEKKRIAALQRAQEKEERRKLEEQQRLQRLQEQEETERLLAEQRRREQEAEKRKEAEARAQQAAVETLKQKNQALLAAQIKYKQQQAKSQGVMNYVLDSEPDEDESDDETKPKYDIPHWAQAHVRKVQLCIQQYIPETIVYKFFDTRKCTPDLTELFHGIDRNRLKRTSSAIWKTPPRISMMETEFVESKFP
ncbi:hypothetical protein PUN28_004380 [Cardiocondyla obscurior]|uniref:Inner centromere protein ARK-binding domain-containing protein n=1 Tax=Cardiocondyla obscurior TaxID=286306 RepID=A0AAW2GCE0_9HYME